MNKLKKSLFLLIAAMFFIIPASVFADDTSSTVEQKKVYVGRIMLENEKFPLSHYKIETQVDDGLLATGDRALASINDGLWSFNKLIAYGTIYAVENLMTFDLISRIADEAATISENIYNGMSNVFVGLFIVIAGGTAAYRQYVNQQTAGAIKALTGVLLISVATLWFFSNTSGNIRMINEFSADLEGQAISTNVTVSSETLNNDKPKDGQESIALLRNQLFNLMVKKPYLLFNYGTTKESDILKRDPNRIDKLLSVKPYGEEAKEARKEIVDDEVKSYENMNMTPDYSGERFGQIFMTIFLTAVIAVPVLAMAGFKFLLQLGLIVLLIFSAIPLIMSLIPAFSWTAAAHFKKIVALVLHKVALTLIISVAVGISSLVYETVNLTSGLEGYMLMVFLVTLVMWGTFKYRNEILEVVSLGYVTSNNAAERITQSATNGFRETISKGIDFTKRVTQGGSDFTSSGRREADPENPEQKRQRFMVVPGGQQEKPSTKRESGSSSPEGNNMKPSAGANFKDNKSGQLSPSRNVSGAENSQNESQKSAGVNQRPVAVKDWRENEGKSRMVLQEVQTPSESRKPEIQTSSLNPEFTMPAREVPAARSEQTNIASVSRIQQVEPSGNFDSLLASMPPEVESHPAMMEVAAAREPKGGTVSQQRISAKRQEKIERPEVRRMKAK